MTTQVSELGGTWAHSYEEDQGDIQVYRPQESFSFPPGRRGRETLDFRQPGTVVSGMPGPDDRPALSSTGLSALGTNRFRIGDARVIEVVELDENVLKIRSA